ncbi:glycoside hydrolase family 3 protein [Eisenbergiella sp.]
MQSEKIAKKIVEESAVLLKNEDQVLPFAQNQRIAFFGRSQLITYFSGNGSGAAKGAKNNNILMACIEKGICPAEELKCWYQAQAAAEAARPEEEFDFSRMKDLVNSGLMYEIFGRYHAPAPEYTVPEAVLEGAAAFTDTAVLVLGRDAGGEECDRHREGDYELTQTELALVEAVCTGFPKVVLVLNCNGLIDLSWTEEYPSLKSILFLGIPGQEGPAALAEILTGAVNPSGKLPVTIARKYEDYPSAMHFSWDKEHPEKLLTYENYGLDPVQNGSVGFAKSPVTVYWEDIYAGYRYFDTFGKKPLFAFGFGLSYTRFEISAIQVIKENDGFHILSEVHNIGGRAGRETVQVYLSAAGTRSERPYQELKGFAKTELLQPGEKQEQEIVIPWRELAVYQEDTACRVVEKGSYRLRLGSSSADTRVIALIEAEEDVVLERCHNRLGLRACNRGKIEFLTQTAGMTMQESREGENTVAKFILSEEDRGRLQTETEKRRMDEAESAEPLNKRLSVKLTALEKKGLLQKCTDQQLAALCVGFGPGIPFSAYGSGSDPETIFDENGKPLTTNSHPVGVNGYVSPALEEKGIYSIFYKDGPAGIGMTAWPSEMLLACAFDRKLWRQFGDAAGAECEKAQVDVWLAPAVNLHRSPLGGRNFEYFSEDPYLTGVCACEVAKGVQENHRVLVCPKHFAVNEQETYRRGSAKKNYDAADSILTERAARELYLKPFEMLVRDAGISCIMTSFNKINGTFAGENADLCTHILREEWGYQGAVVTDWGDMDIVVDGADAVAAGNDIVMPGGPPVIAQILKGLQEKRVTREQMETAVGHLLEMLGRLRH